jgi:hypothetical protein
MQLTQALMPVADAKVPTEQLEHSLADDAAYFPMPHIPVTAEPPVQ